MHGPRRRWRVIILNIVDLLYGIVRYSKSEPVSLVTNPQWNKYRECTRHVYHYNLNQLNRFIFFRAGLLFSTTISDTTYLLNAVVVYITYAPSFCAKRCPSAPFLSSALIIRSSRPLADRLWRRALLTHLKGMQYTLESLSYTTRFRVIGKILEPKSQIFPHECPMCVDRRIPLVMTALSGDSDLTCATETRIHEYARAHIASAHPKPTSLRPR